MMRVDQSKTSLDEDTASARLAALVDQLLAEARTGLPVNIERFAADHPDLAADLRELWAVAALAEEFGSQPAISDGERPSAAGHSSQSLNRIGSIAQSIDDYELLEEL